MAISSLGSAFRIPISANGNYLSMVNKQAEDNDQIAFCDVCAH